jgi:hypothetical protein
MRNQHSKLSDPLEIKPSSKPERDYAPRTYTLKESILLFVKMAAIAISIVALMWLV